MTPAQARAAALARKALAGVRCGDDDAALAALSNVITELGPYGVAAMLCVWADDTIAAEQGPHQPGVIVRPVFTDPLTGVKWTDAGEVDDPATRWCGQFIAARGARHPSYKAFITAIPKDELAEYVTRLLFTCARRISDAQQEGPRYDDHITGADAPRVPQNL